MRGSTGDAVVVVIPASLSSRRLPRKMLLAETGTPLVVHTLEQARRAREIDRVVVATGSDEIRDAVEAAGGDVVMTPDDLPCGTDRIAEAAREIDAAYFINVQGDEPDIDPDEIDAVARALRDGDDAIVTVAQRFADEEEWADTNTVKVVLDSSGRALYFSRSSIPFPRESDVPLEERGYKHVGIYGYERERLLEFRAQPQSPLEKREGLEQLRALDHGWSIRVLVSEGDVRGINSPEDYARFVESRRLRVD